MVESRADHAAARLRQVADHVHEVAAEVRRLDGVVWHSLSADRYRSELAAVALRVERTARVVDQAAQAVGVHARAARGVW